MIDGDEFLRSGMFLNKISREYLNNNLIKDLQNMIDKNEVLERGKRIASELDLHLYDVTIAEPIPPTFYNANHVQRLLGSSVEVFAYKFCEKWHANETIDGTPGTGHTHSAYLIGIKPIAKESREAKMEGLLKEFIACSYMITHDKSSLFERAKKLLEEK